jgi:hypothetical protein
MKRKEREDSPKFIHTRKETRTSSISSSTPLSLSLSRGARKAEQSKCAARTQRALHFLLNNAFFIPIVVIIIIIIIENINSI